MTRHMYYTNNPCLAIMVLGDHWWAGWPYIATALCPGNNGYSNYYGNTNGLMAVPGVLLAVCEVGMIIRLDRVELLNTVEIVQCLHL